MRANAWEEIGKELKIKRKSDVSSRDVRIVCPRLYCHLWLVWLSHIFFTLSHKRFTLGAGGGVIEFKICALIFCTAFIWNISYSKNWIFMESSCYTYQVLMKLEFSRVIFQKNFEYNLSWKSLQWESSCFLRTDGETDGQASMAKLKPGTHYPHVTWAHITFTFYFQLLPYFFPCVGSHMLISIIGWLGVIKKVRWRTFSISISSISGNNW
jgi:hypothetical protein